ncbi:hypothetical protein lerEdw1_015287 [Lerista edwardsae]|nr:hypothetical protein lerEdw1_015287 [Lerista edwardsae]
MQSVVRHAIPLLQYLKEKKAESAAEKSIDLEWQPLEQDEPGNRSYQTAETARSWAKLESELQVLRSSDHPLALAFLQSLERPAQIIAQLLTENHQLQQKQQQDRGQNNQVAELLAENQKLQQELEELKSGQKTSVPQKKYHFSVNWKPFSWNTAFPVQLWITGQTKGCEKKFMDDVTRLLTGQGISLQVVDYQENSKQFLLLFCPVVSHSGTDINNALEGLSSMRKTLLVVCHYKPKGSSQPFVNRGLEGRHPALVTTVHACYTLQDGFYHCQMNTEAVTAVATAIARELRGA